MASSQSKQLCELLQKLTGQRPPLQNAVDSIGDFPSSGLGYSQLNELLLMLGYDRITFAFFQFLVDGKLDYEPGGALKNMEDFSRGVERARQLSLLYFGNVKFGFKRLARNTEELQQYWELSQPLDEKTLRQRHNPANPVYSIPPDQTYFLGYVVQKELEAKLKANPKDPHALTQKEQLQKVRDVGVRNHNAYLVSDHLDVYVATSMRRRHEYAEISEIASQVFGQRRIKDLKLRWFDPTQAYCSDRVDKGLAEALMLRRAKCTLYLAQESDTLGKDSELASTLAQGKPVIAYVPEPTERDIRNSVNRLSKLYSFSESEVILERLQVFAPELAWQDPRVRQWLEKPGKMKQSEALQLLVRVAQEHYRKRAETLRESHPLGIQVHLETGVANGVLVVRNVSACAELIYRIVTRTLQFSIEEKTIEGVEYQFLREKISNSIFRVMTGDAMLTNAFWNFYLEPSV